MDEAGLVLELFLIGQAFEIEAITARGAEDGLCGQGVILRLPSRGILRSRFSLE